MGPQIICILASWLYASGLLLGAGLCLGFLVASGYLFAKGFTRRALWMIGWAIASAGLVALTHYCKHLISDVIYGYWEPTAELIGFVFPGLPMLLFSPEPLRQAKKFVRRVTGSHNRPREQGSSDPTEPTARSLTRVSSLPTRRKN